MARWARAGRSAHSESRVQLQFHLWNVVWDQICRGVIFQGSGACQRGKDSSSYTLQHVLKGNISLCLSQLYKGCFPKDEWRSYLHKCWHRENSRGPLQEKISPSPAQGGASSVAEDFVLVFSLALQQVSPGTFAINKSCGWSSVALQWAHCNHIFPLTSDCQPIFD